MIKHVLFGLWLVGAITIAAFAFLLGATLA